MSTDGLAALEAVFHQVLDGTPAERAALLQQLRADQPALHAEVLALLAAHETPGPLDALGELVGGTGEPAPASFPLPERIGAYRVVELIARGGMGSVYLAQRADGQFEQRVALKLVRSDLDDPHLRDRFLDERRILARIEHPNIARLLDGGFAETGQPYFVMEYVEGEPIDRYCTTHKLSLRARLGLFRTVCGAVHVAHQHLVVHRDIKPANVLVAADGTVKLLDFGIAKLLDPELFPESEARTRAGLRLLTPEYASPEQKTGTAVTTASDVYQLGLMLRQLVIGSATEPPDTNHQRGVPRDVLLIMAAATREEPARRYASADQLSADVDRFLNGMPVSARPDTFLYRTSRFTSRHRYGVATAAAGVLLLAGFAVTTSMQGRRTARERDRAEQVTALLTSFFEANNPRVNRGDTLTVRDVLDRGAERVRNELRAQPETQAALLYNLGLVYRQLGLLEQARTLLTEALEIRRRVLPTRHRDLAASARMLGVTSSELGRPDSAVPLLREAAALVGRSEGNVSSAYAQAIRDLAYGLQIAGQREEAERLYHQALDIHRARGDTINLDVANALNNLGWLARASGQLDTAEIRFRTALALRRQLVGEHDPDVASTLDALATVLTQASRFDEAETIEREVLTINRTVYPPTHPQIASDLVTLARIRSAQRADASADSMFRAALVVFAALREESPLLRAQAQNDYAIFLKERGRFGEAERLFAAALDVYRSRFGDTHLNTDIVRTNLAWVIFSQGRHQEAARLYKDAVARLETALPPTDARVGQTVIDYGATLMNAGAHAEAEQVLRHALELETAGAPAEHWRIARAQALLGACLTRQKRYAAAEPFLLATFTALRKTGLDNPYTRQAAQALASLYQAWNRPDKAREYQAMLR